MGEKIMEEPVEVGELHFSCGSTTKVDVQGDAKLIKGIAAVIGGAPRMPVSPGQYDIRVVSK